WASKKVSMGSVQHFETGAGTKHSLIGKRSNCASHIELGMKLNVPIERPMHWRNGARLWMHGPITARIYDLALGGLARHPDRLIERSDRLQEPLQAARAGPWRDYRRGVRLQRHIQPMWANSLNSLVTIRVFCIMSTTGPICSAAKGEKG